MNTATVKRAAKKCCSEFVSVLLVILMTTTSIFQTLGFLTPFWACGDDYGKSINNVTQTNCTSEGIFFTCANPDGCQSKILDYKLFGLCLTCFLVNIITVPTTLCLSYKQLKKTGSINLNIRLRTSYSRCFAYECLCLCYGHISGRHMFYFFAIGQVLAFTALTTLDKVRNGDGDWSDDWSATIFLYPSFVIGAPMFFLLVIVLPVTFFMILCLICRK